MITSRTHRAHEQTQLLIEIGTPVGKQTGLHRNSVVNCVNLFTVGQASVIQRIGTMPAPLMSQIGVCLKAALNLK